MKTKVLIVGYGKMGKSCLSLLDKYPDLTLSGIVTRRPDQVKVGNLPVFNLSEPESYLRCGADVAVMCGGSMNDLPTQTPFMAEYFSVTDTFDLHGRFGNQVEEDTGQPILGHQILVDAICQTYNHTAIVGTGWHPGMLSMMEAFFRAFFPGSEVYIFYGTSKDGGVSLGHTNALLRLSGVIDALQWTHAYEESMEMALNGQKPERKHWRECKLVVSPDADKKEIEEKIRSMKKYYAEYNVMIDFVTQKELDEERKIRGLAHDGMAIVAGPAGFMEFKLGWNSNPLGTAGILLAYVRGTHRLNQKGHYGCFNVLDVPAADLLPPSYDKEERLKLL